MRIRMELSVSIARRLMVASGILVFAALAFAPQAAVADEGGISIWLPGLYGSLAATPQRPGWSLTSVYYHTSVKASGAAAASREFETGGLPSQATATVNSNLNADANLGLVLPNYVFATPVLGGQAAVGVLGLFGGSTASFNGTLTVGKFDITRSASDSVTGFGDLFPQASLRWNQGVNNFMVYGMSGVPVGAYDTSRLANLGTGHWSIDGGVGYTYFNPQTGRELSAVTGLT